MFRLSLDFCWDEYPIPKSLEEIPRRGIVESKSTYISTFDLYDQIAYIYRVPAADGWAPGPCEVSGQFNTDPWRLSESLGTRRTSEFRIFWILYSTHHLVPPEERSTIQLIMISSVKHMKIDSKWDNSRPQRASWQLRSGFATRYVLELEVCLKKKKKHLSEARIFVAQIFGEGTMVSGLSAALWGKLA